MLSGFELYPRWVPLFHCCGLDSESYKLNDAYQTVIQSLNKTSNQRVFPIDHSSLSFSSAGAWEPIQILYRLGLGLSSTQFNLEPTRGSTFQFVLPNLGVDKFLVCRFGPKARVTPWLGSDY